VADTVTGTVLWTADSQRRQPVWSEDGATVFAVVANAASGSSSVDALDARSGTLNWSTELSGDVSGRSLTGLALIGGGTSLTGPAEAQTFLPSCVNPGDCPTAYPSWSSADGSLTGESPPVPLTAMTGSNPHGGAHFACNTTDTCALQLSRFTPIVPRPTNGTPWTQTTFIRVYKTDGTTLLELSTDRPGISIDQGSMAIAPNGQTMTIATTLGLPGPATVFSVADGTVIGSREIDTATF
jgi:hypothetical protein